MKQITSREFTAIVEAYGADPKRWPAEHRDACIDYARKKPEAAAILTGGQEIDGWLDAVDEEPMPRHLRERILTTANAIPQLTSLERLVGWLFPGTSDALAQLWRPAVAISLPLVVGVLLGMNVDFYTEDTAWEVWEEEIYLTGLSAGVDIDLEEF